MCCKHGTTNYNAPILRCYAANIKNQCFVAAKKFAKSNFWCCMLPFLIQLVQLARFHQYISGANIPVIPVVLVFPAFWSFQLPGRSFHRPNRSFQSAVVPLNILVFRSFRSFQSFHVNPEKHKYFWFCLIVRTSPINYVVSWETIIGFFQDDDQGIKKILYHDPRPIPIICHLPNSLFSH
jgi:hypothetical protein